MSKFKVIVQILKELQIEAEDSEDAKAKAKEEIVAMGITDRFNVQEPRNLTARKEQRIKYEKEKKAKEKEEKK
jgi:predicted ABC-type transport system involved in lysophospholipase L1 biosynthesis ATPase subunit